MSFGFAPKGWALCDGQLLPISQNQALFALLGTNYGGDGRTNFALPNLQGRAPLHMGQSFVLGQVGGEEAHSITLAEMPAHVHALNASGDAADVASPVGAFLANSANTNYDSASSANSAMDANAVSVTGSSSPHENRPPFLVVNICIALQGIFPSQN